MKSDIKLLFYMFFPAGGIGRYTHELAGSMHELDGVNEEVVCSPDYHWTKTERYRVWPGLQTLSHRLPPVRKARFLCAQFVNPRRLVRHAREVKAEVVHFSNINHLSFPTWYGQLRSTGVRMVLTAHDVRRSQAIISRTWEERQLRAAYRSMDAVFVHSEHQRSELMEFADVLPEKIHQVPFGAMPYGDRVEDATAARAQFGLPMDRQVALLFGNIRDDKNIDGFLRAVASLEHRPYVVLAGRAGGIGNRGDDFYQDLIHRLDLQSDVRFMREYIADEDVARLFAACDWSALPYRSSFFSQSAVLNVSAFYHRPVLVSDAPTVAATVRSSDTGHVAEGDGVDDLARGIRNIMAAIEEKHPFDFAEFQARHSWQENARRTRDVYRQILSAPAAS